LRIDRPRGATAGRACSSRRLCALAPDRSTIARDTNKSLARYEGTIFPGYYSPEGDDVRQKFNEWLRTSKAYDGVIDFDVLMRDPSHLTRMLPQHDSGDHLHPNDTGYAMIAKSVNLALLNGRERPSAKR
jgi:lysophospholipase L1-like esterase